MKSELGKKCTIEDYRYHHDQGPNVIRGGDDTRLGGL